MHGGKDFPCWCNLHNQLPSIAKEVAGQVGLKWITDQNITNGLLNSMKLTLILLLCTTATLLIGCSNADTEIPADFPADVPIISGEIYRAKHANFEDGPGFVVDVLTTLSYEEVFAFYADIVGPRGNGYVSVETTNGNTETRYVSIAVHLEGLTEHHKPGSGFVEFVEQTNTSQ